MVWFAISYNNKLVQFCDVEGPPGETEGITFFDLTGGPYRMSSNKIIDKVLAENKKTWQRANDIAAMVRDALKSDECNAVVVHCSKGMERTPLVAACLHMLITGATASDAADWLDTKYTGVGKTMYASMPFAREYLEAAAAGKL